jgi:crotonobetainyl-CoA:carnitine CoA-transferase CaiB-like acyl-CoA transferase
MEFGRAMGNDEPVTPVFPNSDYCTGIIGVVAAVDALMRRAQKGGSYCVDVSVKRREYTMAVGELRFQYRSR